MPVLLPDLVYHGGRFQRDHAVEYDRDTGSIVRVGPSGELSVAAEEVERLVEMGKTGLIEGFVSKRGSNFSAYLTLSKDKKKAEFEFPPR